MPRDLDLALDQGHISMQNHTKTTSIPDKPSTRSHTIIINHQRKDNVSVHFSFELHAKMTEEINLEKCNFWNFRSSVILMLTLDRVVSHTGVHAQSRSTHTQN